MSDSHPLKIFKQTLSNHNPPAFRYSITSDAITVVIYRSEEMSSNLLTIKILIHPSEINLFDVTYLLKLVRVHDEAEAILLNGQG